MTPFNQKKKKKNQLCYTGNRILGKEILFWIVIPIGTVFCNKNKIIRQKYIKI